MNTRPITYPQEDRWSYLWLLIGVLLSMVSWAAFGRWVIPLAAWFSNIFMLRYMCTQRRAWLAYEERSSMKSVSRNRVFGKNPVSEPLNSRFLYMSL